jgi:hypothetical protein
MYGSVLHQLRSPESRSADFDARLFQLRLKRGDVWIDAHDEALKEILAQPDAAPKRETTKKD